MRRLKRGTYKEDEFQNAIHKIVKYIVRHRETSIWVGVGVVVVIVLMFVFISRGEQQNPEADLIHTQAMSFLSAGRLQEAENILLELTQRHQNTRSGKIGLYYLGVIYYNLGRFDEALTYFDDFLRLERDDFLLAPSALYGAGCASEGLKDYEGARNYYKQIIKNKDSHFYLLGMLAYGRTSGIVGDIEKAQEVLKDLLEQNPPTDIAADAEFYLGYFNR